MSSTLLLSIVLAYFLLLLGIAWYTGRGTSGHAFFTGDRKSLWWVVAFGMIGTSLSGVTFISVPGWVKSNHWSYLQVVVGYVIGYWVVAGVLLPLSLRAAEPLRNFTAVRALSQDEADAGVPVWVEAMVERQG